MHAFVLLITVFVATQPATAAHPIIPAHAETKAVVAPSAEACEVGGQALVSQLTQNPLVTWAGYGCFDVKNPADQAA